MPIFTWKEPEPFIWKKKNLKCLKSWCLFPPTSTCLTVPLQKFLSLYAQLTEHNLPQDHPGALNSFVFLAAIAFLEHWSKNNGTNSSESLPSSPLSALMVLTTIEAFLLHSTRPFKGFFPFPGKDSVGGRDLMKLPALKVRWIVSGTFGRTGVRGNLNTKLRLFLASQVKWVQLNCFRGREWRRDSVGCSFPNRVETHLKDTSFLFDSDFYDFSFLTVPLSLISVFLHLPFWYPSII